MSSGWAATNSDGSPHTHGGTDAPECTTCASVLRADHPDYREEWKP